MAVHGKVFKSGNSQAVRLPKSVRLDASEVEITVRGDALILRPRAAASLLGAYGALASIGEDFMPGGRNQGADADRDEL